MRDRATLVSSLALLSGLAAGSYWLAEQARRGDSRPAQLSHEADYFVEDFQQIRMDENGGALYSVDAARMTHFADDDTTALDKPVLISRKPGRPLVRAHADAGRLTSDAEEVHLSGNVELRRAASKDSGELIATTSYLLLLPEEDLARTDKPVKVHQGRSVVDAQSMEYDNGYRNMKFNGLASGRGHALISPRERLNPVAAPAPATR